MPTRLLTLRDVAEDEAAEIRELLEANEIDFYETPASVWGISAGAIWIKDGAAVPRARALLDAYQHQRARRVRALFQELQQQGRTETLLDRLKSNPLRSLAYLVAIIVVLYLSTVPFLKFVP